MNLPVHLPASPVRLRFERALTDKELMAFCAQNDVLRVERNAEGEIELMSPSGIGGGSVEGKVVLRLGLWAEQEKMRNWLENGAELAWLIDPQRRVVEVYRLHEAAEVHQDPTSVQGSGPIAGFELVLSQIWGQPSA